MVFLKQGCQNGSGTPLLFTYTFTAYCLTTLIIQILLVDKFQYQSNVIVAYFICFHVIFMPICLFEASKYQNNYGFS
jgi:hypothetical protein